MVDMNDSNYIAQNYLPPMQQQSQAVSQPSWVQPFVDWILQVPGQTLSLIQQDQKYLLAIVILTFLLYKMVIEKLVSGPGGIILSFLIVMALAFIWVGLVGGMR